MRALGVRGEGIIARGIRGGAKLGAGGAVEGGIFAASDALRKAAQTGDYDHLGENAWRAFKHGARAGALFGGALGFAGGAAGGARDREPPPLHLDFFGELSRAANQPRPGRVHRCVGGGPERGIIDRRAVEFFEAIIARRGKLDDIEPRF